MSKPIIMPEMGEGVNEGTIVRWLKKEGEAVQHDEPILEIETDKVTVEVTAEADGILLKINAAEGQTVSSGTVLALIGTPDESTTEKTVEKPAMSAANNHNAPVIAPLLHPNLFAPMERELGGEVIGKANRREFDGVRVSPVVARMVQIHDIDVGDLMGSGQNGRITKNDVLAYLESTETPTEPTMSVVETTPVEAKVEKSLVSQNIGDEMLPLTTMRRAIAEHMVRSKHTSPHATTVFEFDFTAVSKHRTAHKEQFARDGVKLTYLPYIALATVQALKQYPIVNATWTDDGILLKRDIHLGIAVAVANGLVVPVIKHADRMNLLGLAQAINEVSERARNNQLKLDEVRGGTFTISNHGTSGSLIGTPIINQPQVGIMGVGMIEKRVKVIDDMIAIRPCAYISLSFDHRILDGASADAFIGAIKHSVEKFS